MRGLSLLRRGSVRLGGNDLRLAGKRRRRLGDGAKTRIYFRAIHRSSGKTRFRRAANRPLRWNDLVEASGVVGAQPGVLSRPPLSDPFGADQAKENVTRMIRVDRRAARQQHHHPHPHLDSKSSSLAHFISIPGHSLVPFRYYPTSLAFPPDRFLPLFLCFFLYAVFSRIRNRIFFAIHIRSSNIPNIISSYQFKATTNVKSYYRV